MEEKLTKEQIAELEKLTPEEANQLEALIGSNGEIKEEQLESVVGGLSLNVKKILSWGGAALSAIAIAGASAYAFKKSRDDVPPPLPPRPSSLEDVPPPLPPRPSSLEDVPPPLPPRPSAFKKR